MIFICILFISDWVYWFGESDRCIVSHVQLFSPCSNGLHRIPTKQDLASSSTDQQMRERQQEITKISCKVIQWEPLGGTVRPGWLLFGLFTVYTFQNRTADITKTKHMSGLTDAEPHRASGRWFLLPLMLHQNLKAMVLIPEGKELCARSPLWASCLQTK